MSDHSPEDEIRSLKAQLAFLAGGALAVVHASARALDDAKSDSEFLRALAHNLYVHQNRSPFPLYASDIERVERIAQGPLANTANLAVMLESLPFVKALMDGRSDALHSVVPPDP